MFTTRIASCIAVVVAATTSPWVAPARVQTRHSIHGLIVFVSTREGAASLYAMRPDGSQVVRLPSTTGAQSPRVSPDGRTVVFQNADFDFRVLDISTGRVRPLTPRAASDSGPGLGWGNTRRPWSPNGGQFAIGSDAGLRIFDSDGTHGHLITGGHDMGPEWSPDGTSIAFARAASGALPVPPDAIYVVGVDGREIRLIVRSGDDPAWSPDGRQIAFTRGLTAFVVPASGGAVTRIAPGDIAWSPDSRTLAVAGSHGLRLYDRRGVPGLTLLAGKDVLGPTWSPDGQAVLAVVDGDLWLFSRTGRFRERLTRGELDGYVNGDATWSRSLPRVIKGQATQGATSLGGPLVALSRQTGLPVPGFLHVSGAATEDSNTSFVSSIVEDGRGGWYVGGDFASVAGVPCRNLVHLTSALNVDLTWCPQPNGTIRALVRLGTTLFVGGEDMTRIAGTFRSGLAAFDIRHGRLLRWNPSVKGAIYEMAASPHGSLLYFGGLFDRVGGAARSNFAAVDVKSGAPTAFAPNPDATFHGDSVSAFAVAQTRVYAWGYYGRIGGRPVAGNTAQLDAQTGRLLFWRPATDGGPYSTAVDGDRVIVGGVFSRLGGAHRDDLASFSATTGKVDTWSPATGPHEIVEQVALDSPDVLTVLADDHWEPGKRELVAYDARSGQRTWRARVTFNGSVASLAVRGNLVLVGGSFTHTVAP